MSVTNVPLWWEGHVSLEVKMSKGQAGYEGA